MVRSDGERIIGKLEEFHDWAKKQFGLIEADFEVIRKEISLLNQFKWKVYGFAICISCLSTVLSELIRRVLQQ